MAFSFGFQQKVPQQQNNQQDMRNQGNGQNPPGNQQGNNQQNTQGNNSNQQGENTNQQNNSSTKDDTIATIWDEMKSDDKQQTNQDQNNQSNKTNGAPPQNDPQKDVDNYLDGVGLGAITLSDAELEAFKSGEGVQNVLTNINNRIRMAHLKAVSAANTLIENKVAQAVEKAVKESKSFYKGEQLREILHRDLPFTKDTAIGPVAESAMRKFLEKGASVPEAVEGTKRFFSHINQKTDPNYAPPNTNMRGSFRNNPPAATGGPAGEDENGWLSVLRVPN